MTYVRFHPRTAGRRTASWNPAADIVENNDGYTVNIDLPGFTRKDLAVKVEDGTLTVNGERGRPDAGGEFYHRFERPAGTFTKSFRLPDYIDAENIRGSYKNGVLRLELQKKEAAKPHTVAIG